MSKKPDAAICDVYGGDFVTFAKQAAPLGYFKAIHHRLADGAEVGTIDEAQALGNDHPCSIWSDTYDPAIWTGNAPAAHKDYVKKLKAFMHPKYGSGWAIMGYSAIVALPDAIKKAGGTNEQKVSKALEGLTLNTLFGKRTINAKTHETEVGECWGEMVKEAAYPFAVMQQPKYINPAPFLK